MAGHLRTLVVFLAFACSPALAQVDANLQTLLNALMQGTPVALLTPLPDGTVEVTSFTAPGQRSAADAALLIEQARINLANFGIEQPTGQQLALALAGGTIDVPTGRTQIAGVLPQGTTGVTLRSQIVNASGLPTIVGVSPGGVEVSAGGAAAAGGTANSSALPNGALAGVGPAQQTLALQAAHNQLAALGIANPTPQQVAAMLSGGTITTPAGTPVNVLGLFPSRPAQPPMVTPVTPMPFSRPR